MADEWWNSARSGGTSPCSTAAATDQVTSGWTSATAAAESTSSITFQDRRKGTQQPLSDAAALLVDPHMDWAQALLSAKADTSFHAMLQEDMSTARPYRAHPAAATDESVMNLFSDMSHNFLIDQPSLAPSSYGAATLQSLFDATVPTTSHNISVYSDHQSTVNYDNTPMTPFSQLLKSSVPSAQQHGSSSQLQFSSSYMTPSFLNATAEGMNDVRSGYFTAPSPSQFLLQALGPKPSCSSNTLTGKANSESVQDACSSVSRKSGTDSAAAVKKPRIETPSPLPTFKVRKEKLGDRITALQQLVSPFGKTDTASVLHEAIEYIKFLHDQVAALSTPYLKNGSPMQHQQKGSEKAQDGGEPKQDLRSRGLCLVPIASTYPVASETAPEFWHPTFGGTFR